MPVAMYHNSIVIGRAIIYLILFVKLKSKKTFPTKPHIRDTTLSQ
jgi:hypothetical protein